MKIIAIVIKDFTRSIRSVSSIFFMFGLPILITVMFYLIFGNISDDGEFNLPHTQVIIANLDEGGPNLGLRGKNVPGDFEADTLGELVTKILQSDDLSDFIDVELIDDAASARSAVDNQDAEVAVIIPTDFSRQFADPYEQAIIEFYQDPTLTIGPAIVKSILNQFMDGMAGINIIVDIAIDQAEVIGDESIGQVIQQYMSSFLEQDDDLSASMLEIQSPPKKSKEKSTDNLINIVGSIMTGMMIMYAFSTGASMAENILQEEEQKTLQRLFTTPTPQATILKGKFLSVFFTVFVQVFVLLTISHFIFRIKWGAFPSVLTIAVGTIFCAASFGIFIISLMKNTKQGGAIFGGVITITGWIGMIGIFSSMNIQTEGTFVEIVTLSVPQGWAVRGILQSMNSLPYMDVLMTTLILITWGVIFFTVGIWRFTHRYV